ncbi:hypothetical protein LAUMK4_05706 [Mycobacterium persicum]|uniref:HEAT repeat domain-containing protein n=2 Tax=Mycobacterium persicum TaxID=1487726 RepID=A0ABY6RS57_9MYCO|nr:hypothetical protein LAUMK4_05706 [Mycobacterium persicum]
MRSPGNPSTWPQSEQAMKRQLNAAGIAEDTVWELVNSSHDYPQAVPIIVDWLQHLDERIPPEQDRRAWRAALIRNLSTKHAKGNRAAIDVLFDQFDIQPPLSNLELEAAGYALAKICQRCDFPRVAALIGCERDVPTKSVLVEWIRQIKTEEAKPRQAMKRDLHAAGIPEETVWQLVNSPNDYPQVVPIMVDWLRHIDERVPAGEDRDVLREGLIRNLITKHAKGDRNAIDVLFSQFAVDPPVRRYVLEAAGLALAKICDRSDFPRVAALIRCERDFPTKSVLVQWIGQIKTEEAKKLAVSQLANPATRIPAMKALVRQRATGVRDAVAKYLDDEHEVFHKEARKTLDKLPEDLPNDQIRQGPQHLAAATRCARRPSPARAG